MKLIDILVEDGLNGWKWPDGVECITQDNGSSICKGVAFGYAENPYLKKNIWLANNGTGHADVKIKKYDIVADDWATAIITREQYEAALAAKNDGWIEWGGGECPVPGDTEVLIKCKSEGAWDFRCKQRADEVSWAHDDSVLDVIAYRLHQPQQEEQQEEIEEDLNDCIGQAPVTTWSGEGLPPVGCECEMQNDRGEWISVDIIAQNDGFYFGWNYDYRMVYFSDKSAEFRPLRTEAERKRDGAISDMVETIVYYYGNPKGAEGYIGLAERIIDAISIGKIPGVKLED